MLRPAIGLAAAILLANVGTPSATAAETADLAMTKTSTYDTVRVGGLVTYTVTVTNLGPGAATNVSFGDPIPDQLNLVDSTCGSVAAICTVANLPNGSSSTLTVIATPITNMAEEERRISNTAFIISSDTVDPNPGNDQSSDIVDVVGSIRPCADAARLCIAPHRILFGARPVGTETLRGVTLTNMGRSPLRVLVESALPDDFGFGLLPGSTCPALSPGVLQPFESCRAVVRFTPSDFFAGMRQRESLTVTLRNVNTDAIVGSRLIKVIGRGTPTSHT